MIIGYYAGLLGLFFVFLTLRIVRLRWKYKVGIGDGGEHVLAKAICCDPYLHGGSAANKRNIASWVWRCAFCGACVACFWP